MAENKTKPTEASVEDYIDSRANEQQRRDCLELIALFKKVTRQPPKMWGPSIVGFGSYSYTYESGRTGEGPLAAFAIRGRELVVYVYAKGDKQKALLARVGRHKMGGVCLYFRQLADLNKSVLEKLVIGSIAEVKRRYGTTTMKTRQTGKLKDGARCKVVGGTHEGKRGIVRDINTSKTGHVTVTVVQPGGECFKTLAKNIVIEK